MLRRLDLSDDEAESKSWISIKALRDATRPQSLWKKTREQQSQESSVTMEWKPNPCINASSSFSYLHENYRATEAQNSEYLAFESSEEEELTTQLQRMEDELHSLRRRYMHDTKHLTSTVHKLKAKLHTAHQEQTRLAAELEGQSQKHLAQLQQIQAHHERKLQRHRKDMETVLQTGAGRMASDQEITRLKQEHKEELQVKDHEIERLCRLERELKAQHARFEGQVREQQKQHFEQLTRARQAAKREPTGDAELKGRLREQEEVIVEQASMIDDLQSQLLLCPVSEGRGAPEGLDEGVLKQATGVRRQLQTTLRRRVTRPGTAKHSEGEFDGELKDLISQIR
jgi:hypothetical protein